MLIDSGVWPGVSRISSSTSTQAGSARRRRRSRSGTRPGRPRVAVADRGAGVGGQLEVTGQEVGVEVRLQHLHDRQPVRLGVGEVLGDVALRIDDDGPTRRGVADQVARVGETAEVVLAEEHVDRAPVGVVHRLQLYPQGYDFLLRRVH